MKIFLSALDNGVVNLGEKSLPYLLARKNISMRWNLMSFCYVKDRLELAEFIRDNSEEVMVDSGAHSFQKGKKVDWDVYTEQYAQFIKKFDRSNVIGYFEMDVDNVLGYKKVLELRKKLEKVSDKIIPVWHKNRGINDFYDMCKRYSGKIIAITGFRNEDITDEQYLMFLKVARSYGCRVHCLGMTRKAILDRVPFDYTDSSSWSVAGRFGKIGKRKVTRDFSKTNRTDIWLANYELGVEMQQYYYKKWRKVCRD